jgi:hypothetical protein
MRGDPPGASEDSEEARLRDRLRILDRQRGLATKTGLKADRVPSMATILTGDHLLARGYRTVWQALSLVPGISQGLEVTGERQVLSWGPDTAMPPGTSRSWWTGCP